MACGSRYVPPTSPSVTVFKTNVDTPRHLLSALTAHHIAWNQHRILPILEAKIVVTVQKSNEQIIKNSMAASLASMNVEVTYVFSLIRSWYVLITDVTLVSAIVPLLCVGFRYEHNTALDKRRQQTVQKLTHYFYFGA